MQKTFPQLLAIALMCSCQPGAEKQGASIQEKPSADTSMKAAAATDASADSIIRLLPHPDAAQRMPGLTFSFQGHQYRFYAVGEMYLPHDGNKELNERDELSIDGQLFAPINADAGDDSPDGLTLAYRKAGMKLIAGRAYDWSGGSFTLHHRHYILRSGSFRVTGAKGALLNGEFDATLEPEGTKERLPLTDGKFSGIPFNLNTNYNADRDDLWPDKQFD